MKAVRMGLVTVWFSGFMLIVLSIFATQKLPTIKDRINGGLALTGSSDEKVSRRIVIFTAPSNLSGSVGVRQSTAIRSWLGLSSQIRVVLFSQDPDVVSFAQVFGSRVSVEPSIDFTFLGAPFFHSMVARSWAFPSDITVMIHPETILLPDFVSTLNFAAKLDQDWFLVASPRNVSYFPYNLDTDGLHWLTMDGRKMKTKELQEMLIQSRRWNHYEERFILAWNNGGSPLHTGILPPFLYGKGIHNHWVINEAVLSKLRFVFDASRSISSFYTDSSSQARCCDNSTIEERTWEYAGNSYLGALYGSSLFQEANFTSITRLVKCKSKYLFVDTTDGMIHLFDLHENALDLLERRVLRSHRKRKMMSCVRDIKSQDGVSNWPLKNRLKQPVQLDFPFSLELLLSTLADNNKTIVLGVAGYSYKDMMMSWACRLRSLRITNFIVCALDSETFEFAILQGLPVFRDSSAPDAISFDDCHFGTKCFQKVTKVKSRIVLQILKLGYNVLLSDVDVYWFNNPLPLLSSFPPGVLVAQSDEFNKTGLVRDSNKESNQKREPVGASVSSFDLSASMASKWKDDVVRLIHAGGRAELYQNVLPASDLMDKYPGMCIARPEVFKNPFASILHPEEELLPGQKYYVIPVTTARKLKRKHQAKMKVKEGAARKEKKSDEKFILTDLDLSEDSICSAKDFYVSKEKWERLSKFPSKRKVIKKKPFVPPIPKARPCRSLTWEPSLTSVQEISP